jgi:hypothetical protein
MHRTVKQHFYAASRDGVAVKQVDGCGGMPR